VSSELPKGIQVDVLPSGTGCADCGATDPLGWWLHLRRCAECGHIGCCDTSPAQHATAHAESTGHHVIQSFEPGEDWFYDYETGQAFDGPTLAPPESRPEDHTAPGPQDRVPRDWMQHVHR
ncbi:MAG: UBP-type zinc finger domain-containing protein, partial [Marmoricola sp.]